jgi:tetratricopeptide (TPR) repeat protein
VLAHFYLQHEQHEKAMTLFEALATLSPENPEVGKALSYTYLQMGRFQDAQNVAEDLIRSLPPSSPALAPIYLIQSKALWALGRITEAQAQFQHYLTLEKMDQV